MDDLEQYGRRTSLRFHRVVLQPKGSDEATTTNGTAEKTSNIPSINALRIGQILNKAANRTDTGQIIVNICNNKMNVTTPITVDDIERSHPIGPVRDGCVQVLCKLKHWKTKQRVFMSKSNMKHHKSAEFKVFVTDDLTKKRQFIVQQLEQAREDNRIDKSFWTSDDRILYKIRPKDKVRTVNEIGDIDHLLPDPTDQMTENPWDKGNPVTFPTQTNSNNGVDLNLVSQQ